MENEGLRIYQNQVVYLTFCRQVFGFSIEFWLKYQPPLRHSITVWNMHWKQFPHLEIHTVRLWWAVLPSCCQWSGRWAVWSPPACSSRWTWATRTARSRAAGHTLVALVSPACPRSCRTRSGWTCGGRCCVPHSGEWRLEQAQLEGLVGCAGVCWNKHWNFNYLKMFVLNSHN